MPIYEYRCTSCGQVTEVIQKLSEAPLTECTACSGRLEKLFSVAAFQLKGGGWFSDGYGRGSAPEASQAPKAEGDAAKKGNGTPAAADSGSSGDGSRGSTDTTPRKAAGGGCGSGCGCGH